MGLESRFLQHLNALICEVNHAHRSITSRFISSISGSRKESVCVFQMKSATDSIRKLPPIPFEACH